MAALYSGDGFIPNAFEACKLDPIPHSWILVSPRFLRDRRDRLLGAERVPSTDAAHVILAIAPLFLALHVRSRTAILEYHLLWAKGICDYAYTPYLMKPLKAQTGGLVDPNNPVLQRRPSPHPSLTRTPTSGYGLCECSYQNHEYVRGP